MSAALAHVIGDILQSLGVCVAAALIWAFSDRWPDGNGVSYWYRADPVCTFLFSLLVLWSSVGTVKEAVHADGGEAARRRHGARARAALTSPT